MVITSPVNAEEEILVKYDIPVVVPPLFALAAPNDPKVEPDTVTGTLLLLYSTNIAIRSFALVVVRVNVIGAPPPDVLWTDPSNAIGI